MQAFGVEAGVEAMSRKKQVAKPRAVATLSDVRRRAAQYSDIVDIAPKRRVQSPSTEGTQKTSPEVEAVDIDAQRRRRPLAPGRRAAQSVLPSDAASYDGPARGRRSFFDGAVHAERYARLLGRPDADEDEEDVLPIDPSKSALCELEAGTVPIHIVRMVEALLPGKSDRAMQGMPPEVFDRVRMQVMQMVNERLAHRAVPKSSVCRLKRPSVESSSTAPGLEPVQLGHDDSLLEDESDSLESSPCMQGTTPGDVDMGNVPADAPAQLRPTEELPTLLSPSRARAMAAKNGTAKDAKRKDAADDAARDAAANFRLDQIHSFF